MLKRIWIYSFALCAFLGVSFYIYAWHHPILPIIPIKPSYFSSRNIQHGALLAEIGRCAQCHTRRDGAVGAQFAGDYQIKTSFGVIYTPNITPDVKTGIGGWSEEAFARALRQGISRDGRQLYAIFPFAHYTKMTDQDIADLYAYFMTRPQISQIPRQNHVVFPLNWRFLQGWWKLFYLSSGMYKPERHHDPLWNRGAYLAEAVAHCSSCHTPHNEMGAEISSKLYGGAKFEAGYAPALNAHNPSPLPWSEEELYHYLREGRAPLHGNSVRAMGEIIHQDLVHLPDADIHALAHYFADKMRRPEKEQKVVEAKRAFLMQAAHQDLEFARDGDEAARLYQVTCAQCHSNFRQEALPQHSELGLNSFLWMDDPTDFLQIVIFGITSKEGQKGVVMPSFVHSLSDHDIAAIAAYLRRTRTNLPAWTNLEKKVAVIRAQMKSQTIISQ